jgi:hypothetical protein
MHEEMKEIVEFKHSHIVHSQSEVTSGGIKLDIKYKIKSVDNKYTSVDVLNADVGESISVSLNVHRNLWHNDQDDYYAILLIGRLGTPRGAPNLVTYCRTHKSLIDVLDCFDLEIDSEYANQRIDDLLSQVDTIKMQYGIE